MEPPPDGGGRHRQAALGVDHGALGTNPTLALRTQIDQSVAQQRMQGNEAAASALGGVVFQGDGVAHLTGGVGDHGPGDGGNFTRPQVGLNRQEEDNRIARRTLFQTGARVSEFVAIEVGDFF